jgi:hypothetical protein
MTTVISSRSDRYQVLSQNAIDEPIFATPAISQGQLFIRAPSRLWCIGGAARPQRSTEVKEKLGRRQSQTESKLSPAGHFAFAVAPGTRP